MESVECMEGVWAIPQRCNYGCSVYWQCVFKGYCSEIQYHSKPWRECLWFPVKGKRSIGCLVDIPLEWYERTPNDAQQAESVVLWIVMWLRDPSLSCAQSACHHEQWVQQRGVLSVPSVHRFPGIQR
ncbi:hypothetical protein TNCV_1361891 [Trichonephila clavipes]|nr:hypothetical protein TNCV_1361891 [Trichonephila clavipes]